MRAALAIAFCLVPILAAGQSPGTPPGTPPANRGRQAPTAPDLEAVKREYASLSKSGYAQQVAALRKLTPLRTTACAEFLAEVYRTTPEAAVKLEALRLLGIVGQDPAAAVLKKAAAKGTPAERPTALNALASLRPPVGAEPFLAALDPSEPLSLRAAAARALSAYPTREVAARLAATLVEQPPQSHLVRACEGSLTAIMSELGVSALGGDAAGAEGAEDAGAMDADPELIEWVIEVGLARTGPLRAALPALLRVVGGCPDSTALKDAVYPHLRDPEPEVRAAAADALGRLTAGKGALAQHTQDALARLLKDRDPDVVVSAAVALGAIGPSGDALDGLIKMGRSRNPALEALALTALEGSRDARVLKLARKGLKDKSPSVRAAAVATLKAMQTKEAVTALVEGLKKNDSGRIQAELLAALRALTGADPGDDHTAWDRWWSMVVADFALPSGRQATAGVQRRSSGETSTRGLPTYHGSEVVSERVTFVVDVSGSMSAQVQDQDEQGQTRSRIALCQQELKGVIAALPKRAFFNVVWFSSGFTPWATELTPAGPKQKGKAIEAVGALKAGGGTNIFDALEHALSDPEVDTIYLLSDGAPGAGRIVDPDAILREVKKLNAIRRVAIHTISIGSKSPFMASLAQQNGGQAIVR